MQGDRGCWYDDWERGVPSQEDDKLEAQASTNPTYRLMTRDTIIAPTYLLHTYARNTGAADTIVLHNVPNSLSRVSPKDGSGIHNSNFAYTILSYNNYTPIKSIGTEETDKRLSCVQNARWAGKCHESKRYRPQGGPSTRVIIVLSFSGVLELQGPSRLQGFRPLCLYPSQR